VSIPDFDIKARCYVDPEGCWRWLGNSYRGIPIIQHQRKRYRVARLAKHIPAGRYAMLTCGHRYCVNPAHIRSATKAEYVREGAKNRRLMTYVERRKYKEPTAKLDYSKAAEIRAKRGEGKTLRELGRLFGVNRQTIHNIVTNRSWREASPWAI
jgi:DNA-binding XRE family transcriptional regulator